MLSVVSPSFNQLNWLKLCAPSIADQEGVEYEHIVQDAGMYDAINRGLRRRQGEICAYLNCDDQYLPGALARVEVLFQAHSDLDELLADSLVVGAAGRYSCSRPALTPLHWWVACAFSPMSVLTGGIFFRRPVFEERGVFFRTDWRTIGDTVWTCELVQKKLRMMRAGLTTSVFTDTGKNLCLDLLPERDCKIDFAHA